VVCWTRSRHLETFASHGLGQVSVLGLRVCFQIPVGSSRP
jgi:hypothetical protein